MILGRWEIGHEGDIRAVGTGQDGTLTLYCSYLYSYPIGIPLFETRLTSPLGQ